MIVHRGIEEGQVLFDSFLTLFHVLENTLRAEMIHGKWNQFYCEGIIFTFKDEDKLMYK